MKLFALVSDVISKDESYKLGRRIVENYLKRQLNQQQCEIYLQKFDSFFTEYHGGIGDDTKKAKRRASLNAIKIISVCDEINLELRQEQKLIVIFQILEFISVGKEVTESELEFAETVADSFKILHDEFIQFKEFVFGYYDRIVNKNNLLIIQSNANNANDNQQNLTINGLDKPIAILIVRNTNTMFLKYFGHQELYLNGHLISSPRIRLFDKGSIIRGSKIQTIYFADVNNKFLEENNKQHITFTVEEAEFHFPNSPNGLQRFSFSENTGTLVGIMGGSGVGKSTLLNILNGTLEPQNGKICINGFDIYKEKDKIKGLIGFIPQDDLLMDELTVYQNLYFNAQLCFDNLPDNEIKNRVNFILAELDLFAIKDLTVGSPLNKFISGGQRKRLNIALELIREPVVLFVDEPTSGLSSMDSEMVMDLLKELTYKGKLVIVNIHQPSSDIYKMFDKLIFMDKGGYPIYYGNPTDAVLYFKAQINHINATESHCLTCGNVNPEQVLQIIESKVVDEYGKLTKTRKISQQEWYDAFVKKIVPTLNIKSFKTELPSNQFKIPGLFKQLKIFISRDVMSKITNRQYLIISLLEAPLLAFILGFVTRYIDYDDPHGTYVFAKNSNLPAFIFMSVIVSLFVGLTVSAEEIIKDRKIRQREKFLNLSWFSYINSKVVILFILSAFQTLLFVLIGNSLLGIKGLTVAYWLILFSTSFVANLIGLNISSAFNSVITVYILIPFIIVPQLIFSGLLVKFDKLNNFIGSADLVPVLGDIMPSRWSYEALVVVQFKNNEYQKYFFDDELVIKYNTYIASGLISQLQSKVDELAYAINKQDANNVVPENLKTLQNEILGLQKMSSIKFDQIMQLEPKLFTTAIASQTKQYLERLKKFYFDKINAATQIKDKKMQVFVANLKNADELNVLRSKYYNQSLADLVLNAMELTKFYEVNNHIIPISNPIYMPPETNYGRSHFYAPYKKIGTLHIDTFWFNFIVLWIMALVFYVALYFEWLKKLLEIKVTSH